MNGTENTSSTTKLPNDTEVRTTSFADRIIPRVASTGESARKRQRVPESFSRLRTQSKLAPVEEGDRNLSYDFGQEDFDSIRPKLNRIEAERMHNLQEVRRSSGSSPGRMRVTNNLQPTESDGPQHVVLSSDSNGSQPQSGKNQVPTDTGSELVETEPVHKDRVFDRGAAVAYIQFSKQGSVKDGTSHYATTKDTRATTIPSATAKSVETTNSDVILIESEDDRDSPRCGGGNEEAVEIEMSAKQGHPDPGACNDIQDVDGFVDFSESQEPLDGEVPLDLKKHWISPPSERLESRPSISSQRTGSFQRRGSRCIEKRPGSNSVINDHVQVYECDNDHSQDVPELGAEHPSQPLEERRQGTVQPSSLGENLSEELDAQPRIRTDVLDDVPADEGDKKKDPGKPPETANVDLLALEEEQPDYSMLEVPSNSTLFRFPPHGKGNITVQYEDYLRLQNNEYMNDTLIDFYLKIIEQKQAAMVAASKGTETRLYFFTSFFFGRLRQNKEAAPSEIQYNGVKRWTRNVDLFKKELSFMPVCESSHWSLIILANMNELVQCMEEEEHFISLPEVKKPRILYLDSLEPKRGQSFGKIALHYLSAEYTERKSNDPSAGERKDNFVRMRKIIDINWPYVPMQINEVDCGLYLLHNINCFLDESTGMKMTCLQGPEKDVKIKQRWMKTLYTHVEVDLLRAQILDLMQQLEEGNKSDGGKAPQMPLCVLPYTEEALSEHESPPADTAISSRDETRNDNDDEPKVVVSQEKEAVDEAAAIVAATDPPRTREELSTQADDDCIEVVGERKRHSLPLSFASTIPPDMAYGSGTSPPVKAVMQNYKARNRSDGHPIMRMGARRYKEMPQRLQAADNAQVVEMDVDKGDEDVEMEEPQNKRRTVAPEVIDVDMDGDVNMGK